ncbi:uncharacterized protein LOC125214311 isoform X2 [Salvia hispanica]|uniref:uncharacterized protein LOC125214311 isoform X2 n=1 Tax=Salvia hispanica TaxID=49212 RepID=UPI002009257D|nr:uncharacterized protein LOC125214311 isoform X2 [Salvia hispanica]
MDGLDVGVLLVGVNDVHLEPPVLAAGVQELLCRDSDLRQNKPPILPYGLQAPLPHARYGWRKPPVVPLRPPCRIPHLVLIRRQGGRGREREERGTRGCRIWILEPSWIGCVSMNRGMMDFQAMASQTTAVGRRMLPFHLLFLGYNLEIGDGDGGLVLV